MNPAMLAAYTPRLAEHFLPLGVPSDDGLGSVGYASGTCLDESSFFGRRAPGPMPRGTTNQ